MTLGIASIVGEVCGKSLIVSVHTQRWSPSQS